MKSRGIAFATFNFDANKDSITHSMIKYVTADIPQAIVLPTTNYSNISKRFLKEINDTFLWSYLGQKFSEYSIKNYFINEQLREIYLIHTLMMKSRMGEEMYPM